MTKLLEQAIAEIEKLPEDAQDAIAARLLADLADEKEWVARFAATTEAQWDRMAAMVRREIAAGDTEPLDDVFPTLVSKRWSVCATPSRTGRNWLRTACGSSCAASTGQR